MAGGFGRFTYAALLISVFLLRMLLSLGVFFQVSMPSTRGFAALDFVLLYRCLFLTTSVRRRNNILLELRTPS